MAIGQVAGLLPVVTTSGPNYEVSRLRAVLDVLHKAAAARHLLFAWLIRPHKTPDSLRFVNECTQTRGKVCIAYLGYPPG
jgi:hypothetical protein